MFKLEIENIGTGFQTLGRGHMGNSPQIGMARKSKLTISGQDFLDYEHDIRYFHTAHCGEVRMQLLVDGEITNPDDVKSLVLASEIADKEASDTAAGSLTPADAPTAEDAPAPVAGEAAAVEPVTALKVDYTGARVEA